MLKVMNPNQQAPGQQTVPQQPATQPVIEHPFAPSPAPAQQPANPYGFIFDDQHPQPKKSMLKPGKNSMRGRILMVLGIGMVIIVVIVVGSSLLSGKKAGNAQQLTALVAEQQEIIRVANLGVAGARDPSTVALAETTKLSITTQQNKLLGYLKTRNIKITPLAITAKLNKSTTTELTNATANNTFDDTFTKTLQTELTTYQTNVKKSYDTASNPTSKALLKLSYSSSATILK